MHCRHDACVERARIRESEKAEHNNCEKFVCHVIGAETRLSSMRFFPFHSVSACHFSRSKFFLQLLSSTSWRLGVNLLAVIVVGFIMCDRQHSIARGDDKPAEQAVTIDKDKKTVTIACQVAPRKLPNLTEVYPIEVIATLPAPAGKKAHETVVTFSAKPSEIHAALVALGLKPGKPARGEDATAAGPELKIFLEIPGPEGKSRRLPIEKMLVDRKTGKPLPNLKWHFTGSIVKEAAPGKTETVYGADATGTLIALFPVTDETVIQTNLTMKEEPLLKLETNPKVLPAEGTPVKLVIEVK